MAPRWNPRQVQNPPPGDWYWVPILGPGWQYIYDVGEHRWVPAFGNFVLTAAEAVALEAALEQLFQESPGGDPPCLTKEERCAALYQQWATFVAENKFADADAVKAIMMAEGCDAPDGDDEPEAPPDPSPVKVPIKNVPIGPGGWNPGGVPPMPRTPISPQQPEPVDDAPVEAG